MSRYQQHQHLSPLQQPAYYVPGSPVDEHQVQQVRNSRAIGVLWAVFTMCYAIINVVVFVQPQWLGDTETSKGTGYFGLWKSCRLLQDGQDLVCEGGLEDGFASIASPAFRAATLFVALSVLVIFLCLCSFLLFFFVHSSTVFHVCAWLQATSGKRTLSSRPRLSLSLTLPSWYQLSACCWVACSSPQDGTRASCNRCAATRLTSTTPVSAASAGRSCWR